MFWECLARLEVSLPHKRVVVNLLVIRRGRIFGGFEKEVFEDRAEEEQYTELADDEALGESGLEEEGESARHCGEDRRGREK